jgi:hypothetical protein
MPQVLAAPVPALVEGLVRAHLREAQPDPDRPLQLTGATLLDGGAGAARQDPRLPPARRASAAGAGCS